MFEQISAFLSGVELPNLNALLLIGLAIFGGTIGGRIFKRIRIPQVVGYIIIGILVGKMGAGLLSSEVLESFEPFNDFALGIIGFLIGGELKKSTLKKYGSQFAWILIFEAMTAFFVTSLLIFAAGMLIFGNWTSALVLALLLGSISAATAAAGTTDVLWESKTRGPLTTTILGIIALDDILSLFIFAVVASLGGVILGGGANISHEMLMLLYEIGGALVLGAGAGILLARILKESSDRERTLTFSMSSILLVLGLASALEMDTILAAMVMGVAMTNVAPKKSEEVFHIVESFAPPLYVMFFVFVGANLNVGAMDAGLYIFAAVYLVGRSSGKMLGAFLGAMAGKSPKTVRQYLPLSLFSQSGVAIGLAIISAQRFPGVIGTSISLIVTATTFIVQILGPVLLKIAVHKAGEAGLNVSETDIIRDSSVQDVMDARVPMLPENLTIDKVLTRISDSDSQFFPVVDAAGKLRGVLSIEGVKNAYIARELTDMILTADLMENPGITADSSAKLEQLIEDMNKRQEEFVPVVDEEGKPMGIIEERGIKRFVSRKIIEMQSRANELAGETA